MVYSSSVNTMDELLKQLAELQALVVQQAATIAQLEATIAQQAARMAELEQQLADAPDG